MGEVTRSWLRQNGRAERGFALGYHDRSYLARSPIYALYDAHDRLIAFANGIHSYNPKQATIDLMRYRHEAETGVMDYLSLCIMQHLYNTGWKEFSFGLAPLSGLDAEVNRNLESRALARLARINVSSFSFDGLRRYKNKFKPRWEPRYLAYDRGGVGLGMTALAISRLTKPVKVDEA
jgi:phosphatidylglycerol lysyltransferase